MKRSSIASRGRFWKWIGPCQRGSTLVLALVLAACPLPLPAQLAITEVMASAALTWGPGTVLPGPDFWELTNFGTNDINLDGYFFRDIGATRQEWPFVGLTIHAGETIIFLEVDTGSLPPTRPSSANCGGAPRIPQ